MGKARKGNKRGERTGLYYPKPFLRSSELGVDRQGSQRVRRHLAKLRGEQPFDTFAGTVAALAVAALIVAQLSVVELAVAALPFGPLGVAALAVAQRCSIHFS